MPKVDVRLRRIDFIKTKQQGMLLYSLTDFWFCMLKISGVYNKDGAKRRHNLSRASWSNDFRHFRHFSTQGIFPVYPGIAALTIYLINQTPEAF